MPLRHIQSEVLNMSFRTSCNLNEFALRYFSSISANLLNMAVVIERSSTMSNSEAMSNNCLLISIVQSFSPLKKGIPVVCGAKAVSLSPSIS